MPERNREYLKAYVTAVGAIFQMRLVSNHIVVENIKELSIFEGETKHALLLQGIGGTLFYIPTPRPVSKLKETELELIEETYCIATNSSPGEKIHIWDLAPVLQEG